MNDTRFAAVRTPRTSQVPQVRHERKRFRRPRRLALLLAIAVTAALVVPSVAVTASGHRPAAAPNTGVSAAACTRTVKGFTAAAVHSARNGAGSGGIVCFPAGTYSGNLSASVAGQTWRLADNTTLTGEVHISGTGVRLLGGNISRSEGNRWIASVQIRAHRVTVQSVNFWGGGTGINVHGVDRSRIISNSFRGLSGSAISIWSEGVGADRTLIDRNKIIQSATYQVSPITSRGNESGTPGGVQNYRTVIRRNTINQGPGDVGWFGIELKQSRGAIIERNSIKGGRVLLSLPETNNAVVRWNWFDLVGSPNWGIEVGNAHDAAIYENTFVGDGRTGVDYAIALNTNSQRTMAYGNAGSNLRTFFGIAGDGHRITDNCLKKSVRFVHEFRLNGGPNIVIARNRC